MRTNNEQKFYTTLDSYQSGFLLLNGYTPKLIEQGNKVVFCFDATEELYQTISDYNAGATVEAVRFTLAIKNLKSQIFSLRRNKEKWDTTNRESNTI